MTSLLTSQGTLKTRSEEIFYEQRIISHGEVLLDTENIEVETIELDNQAIILFTNKGVNQVH